jgi:hypothetical protein
MASYQMRKPKDMPSSVMSNGRWNPFKVIYLDNQMHVDPFKMSVTNASIARFGSDREKMRMLRRQYTYAIPSNDIHSKIREFCGDKIIEMGAGTGYWAKYLSQFEIDVVAFDTIETRSEYCDDIYYYDIGEGGPEALNLITDRALLLVWPPYNEPFAYDCLKAYKGDNLISVGEGYGGCTGDDTFFNLVEEEWDIVHCNYDCLNFYGISSFETIYKRKSKEAIEDLHIVLEEEIY